MVMRRSIAAIVLGAVLIAPFANDVGQFHSSAAFPPRRLVLSMPPQQVVPFYLSMDAFCDKPSSMQSAAACLLVSSSLDWIKERSVLVAEELNSFVIQSQRAIFSAQQQVAYELEMLFPRHPFDIARHGLTARLQKQIAQWSESETAYVLSFWSKQLSLFSRYIVNELHSTLEKKSELMINDVLASCKTRIEWATGSPYFRRSNYWPFQASPLLDFFDGLVSLCMKIESTLRDILVDLKAQKAWSGVIIRRSSFWP